MHRVGVAPLEQRGGQADRGHRVARRRLGHDRVARPARAAARDTASRCAAPVTTTNRSPTSGPSRSRVAWIRVRPDAGEVVQELRRRRPRQRPQPGARPARGHHGPEVVDGPRGVDGPVDGRGHGRTLGRGQTRAGDDLRDRPRRPAAPRRRPPARHLLRRRDRRAGRAVGDDVRQLGREDRVAARRGARPRARVDAARRPAAPLADPVFLGRRVDGRPVVTDDADPDAVVCGPTPWPTLGAPGRRPPGAGVLAAAAGCPVRRAAAGRRARRRRRGLVPARRVHGRRTRRPGPTPRPTWRCPHTQAELWSAAAAGSLLTDGGRLLSGRTRLPHRGSPPSPSRSRAAAPWSWSLGPDGNASRRPCRRARHRPLPCLSDRTSSSPHAVVDPEAAAEDDRRAEALARRVPWSSTAAWPAACARPGRGVRQVDVADRRRPSRTAPGRAASCVAPHQPAGAVAGVHLERSPLRNRRRGPRRRPHGRPTIWRAG